ncbi:MAG: DedA family protein [Treponema sp.]|nr:DedA family protein [Treponema sp.]
MPDIIAILSHYIHFFPLVALIGLLLAGLNLPISEDLIIITAAIVCHKEPSLLPLTLAVLYIGVISTDFFVYFVGANVRKGTGKIKIFARFFPQKALDKMHHYLEKYGIFTFIICRFIPFGIRNTLFFTSGFFNLRIRSFFFYDIIAAMISVNTLFFLVYAFGEVVRRPIKIAGIIMFIAISSAIISMFLRFFISWLKKKRNGKNPEDLGINQNIMSDTSIQ